MRARVSGLLGLARVRSLLNQPRRPVFWTISV
jgi:hypothetical protein